MDCLAFDDNDPVIIRRRIDDHINMFDGHDDSKGSRCETAPQEVTRWEHCKAD